MNRFILLQVATCAAMACGSRPEAPNGSTWTRALIDSVMRLGREDQDGRNALSQAVATGDTATLLRFMRADSARSRWLRDAVKERGWPARSIVGDSAALSAWLILQHTPFHDWQENMLPTLEQLADRGDVRKADLAVFTDRVLVHRGQPQRYGSQFGTVDGRLVPEPIDDVAQLDARRAGVGLPPMAEYVRMLGEMSKLPMVWPPG